MLLPGDPAPWFAARSSVHSKHLFDRVAGNYIVMTFLRDPRLPAARALLAAITERAAIFDDVNARWFIVTGRGDADGLPLRSPGIRAFFDPGGAIRALYGLAGHDSAASYVLSPRLHVIGSLTEADPAEHAAILVEAVRRQTPTKDLARTLGPPPILMIPDVFEAPLCRILIDGYRANGGEASGFAIDEKGMTRNKLDSTVKVRRDWMIEDPKLRDAIGARFQRRVVPEIRKAYHIVIRHMERHLVGCYDAADGGHFSAHRDNDAMGAVHRQFACSLNLNVGEYEGGDLRFPEFGPQTYRPPTGGCVIFSCSLLHVATKVSSGTRYVFLPFLHDDEAEKVRQKNFQFLEPETVAAPVA